MKCEIIGGVLVLTPGSETERYALAKWTDNASVAVNDVARNESIYIRGSCVKICNPPQTDPVIPAAEG